MTRTNIILTVLWLLSPILMLIGLFTLNGTIFYLGFSLLMILIFIMFSRIFNP